MGDKTGIEWTNHTWNPWQGCHRVSAGCARCYMYSEKRRYGQDPTVVRRSKRETFNAPLRWKEPPLVFTCSWSDFFIADADAWRQEAWDIIRRTPHLVYQILTKRPERIHDHLPDDWGEGWANVWLGVTVETGAHLSRVMMLKEIHAVLRFVSYEPAIGPVEFRPYLKHSGIDWLVAGCESGPGGSLGRPTHPDWLRSARDGCQENGVPFFLKQMDVKGKLVKMPELDGRTWAEMPRIGVV
jgi:protein gp37